MNLHRLIYTSARRPHCTSEEMENLLNAARRNNIRQHITGVLLHSRHRFLQYLEGEGDQIIALYEKISADERHGGCMIRDYAPIAKRTFPSCEMGYKDITEDKLFFNTRISLRDRAVFENLLDGRLEDGDIIAKVVKRFFQVTEETM